jgi:single-strand DNA-binding protein
MKQKMAMSLNRAMLIGHVTAAPELRYTPQGTPVCTFTVATNRVWTDQASGQRQESAEFTRCVAWRKLAEICSQVLAKGRQVYVDGRLQTREWETQERGKQRTTEMVLENMIALGPSSGRPAAAAAAGQAPPVPTQEDLGEFAKDEKVPENPKAAAAKPKSHQDPEVPPEDIPF